MAAIVSMTNPDGFVYRAVRRYVWATRGGALGVEDLMQVGRMALVRAERTFDPARSGSFAAYATHLVWQSVRHAALEQSLTVRVPIKRQVRGWREGAPVRNTTRSLDAVPEGRAEPVAEDALAVRAALARLSPQHRDVLVRRFVLGEASTECGAALGVSRQRVDQIQAKALAALRYAL